MSENDATHEGHCYCGAVKVVVTGDAVGEGYCHCKTCRKLFCPTHVRKSSGGGIVVHCCPDCNGTLRIPGP